MFSEISVLCNRPQCNLWSAADPASDTVKVDSSRFDKDHNVRLLQEDIHAAFHATDNESKENARPPPLEVAAFQAAMKERQEQEALREKALQEARARREQERRLERERHDAERRAVEHLAEERQERERAREAMEAEEERRRSEENLQRIREAERRQQEERQREADRLQKEEMERSAKVAQDKKVLDEFLSRRGYSGVNAKRTKMLRSKYPLHSAVKDNSVEIAEFLLAAGADTSLRSSAGLTPAHLAMKLNVNGSHDEMLRTLQMIRTVD